MVALTNKSGTTYTFTTLSGKVTRQEWGTSSIDFLYDDSSQPFAFIYKAKQSDAGTLYLLREEKFA